MKKLDHMGVSAFCESMAMMVRSGIQTDEAVYLLASGSSAGGGVLEGALVKMKEKVEAGESLSNAMEETGIFPDYALRMVQAGESSGRLEKILFRLSNYYAQQKSISEKLRNAVTYPAAMLVMIIAVLSVIITAVLPAFSDVYDKLTGELASSNYAYVRWGYIFCAVALGVMVVLAACLIVGFVSYRGNGRKKVEKLLGRFSLTSDMMEDMSLFRFTSALSTFLASGEMQDEAVEKSLPMADYAPVEEKLTGCLERMKEGHSISQAAYDENLFEPVYGRMLLAGERSGEMENVLERLSALLEEKISSEVDRLVGLVDPLLSGVLMVTVGLTLLSVMLPLIGMMNSIA